MSTDVSGLTTNFFPSPQSGFSTTLATTISAGATTVPLNSVAGYSNGQIAVFVVDPANPTSKQTFTGVVDTSGVQLTSVVWTAGTNQSHPGGTTVVDYVTATHLGMITKGILKQHTQAGAHTGITTDTITATGRATLSGGTTLPAGDIGTADLAAASVTADKLFSGAKTAPIATSESSNSGSYVGLTTPQNLSVTVGANGLLLVTVGADSIGTGGNSSYMSFALSGTNTLAASDANGILSNATTIDTLQYDRTVLLTGLTPGVTTVTAQFRIGGGSGGTWKNRNLVAIPL